MCSPTGSQRVCGRGQEVKVTGPRLGGKNRGCLEKMEGSATEGPAEAGHPFPEERERAGSEGESAQRGARTPKAVVWMMGVKRTRGDSGRTRGPAVLLSQCHWQPGAGPETDRVRAAGVGGDGVKRQAAGKERRPSHREATDSEKGRVGRRG